MSTSCFIPKSCMECCMVLICRDMIKWNESDVRNIDFEFQAKRAVLYCFELCRIVHIFATRCPIGMGFGWRFSILNGKVIFIERWKLNIADMWLIPLDCVTYHVDKSDDNQCCVCYHTVYSCAIILPNLFVGWENDKF